MSRDRENARRAESAADPDRPQHRVEPVSVDGARAHPDPVGLIQLQRRVGNAAVSSLLGSGPASSPGEPLAPATRSRLETGLGTDLSDVTLATDGAAAARENAAAFTVGSHIVVDPAHYRPGTASGDGLLAHEAAHVVQQRDPTGPVSDGPELEAEADRAAVATVTEQAPSEGLLPRLKSALSLRRCSGCSDPEKERLDRFRDASSPEQLEAMLRPATDDQLSRLSDAASSADTVHTDAVAWERAFRRKDFTTLSELSGRSAAGFRTAYAPRVLTLIMGGTVGIKVDPTNPDFVDFVRSSLTTLLALPSGFRLIIELLAAGQTVNLRFGADQTTNATDPEAARAAGSSEPGPRGSGSTVTLNPELAKNQVGLGGQPGQLQVIKLDPAMTVGHELIHALNNARGTNIAPLLSPALLRGLASGAGLVRDPVTGEPQSPEELRTVSGQTAFPTVVGRGPDGPTQDFGPGAGVSENDLRRDAGLAARMSHFGATDTTTIPLGSTRSVDALAARYRLPSGPVPTAGAAAIRAFLLAQGFDLAKLPANVALTQIAPPTGEHVVMHIRFVLGNAALADQLTGLTVS